MGRCTVKVLLIGFCMSLGHCSSKQGGTSTGRTWTEPLKAGSRYQYPEAEPQRSGESALDYYNRVTEHNARQEVRKFVHRQDKKGEHERLRQRKKNRDALNGPKYGQKTVGAVCGVAAGVYAAGIPASIYGINVDGDITYSVNPDEPLFVSGNNVVKPGNALDQIQDAVAANGGTPLDGISTTAGPITNVDIESVTNALNSLEGSEAAQALKSLEGLAGEGFTELTVHEGLHIFMDIVSFGSGSYVLAIMVFSMFFACLFTLAYTLLVGCKLPWN